MGQIIFNNKILVEPQAAGKTVVGIIPSANPAATGRVIVLGASEGGAPDTLTWFTDSNGAKAILRDGDALRAMSMIFNPSNQEAGAPFVGFVRTQAATKAEYDATSGKIVSKDYGTYVNNINVQVEDGTDANSTKITVNSGDDNEVHDNLDLALTIQYVGSAVASMIAVTAGVVTGTSGPTTGLENTDFSFDTSLVTYNTVTKLVTAINALGDWDCSIYKNAPGGAGSLAGSVLNTLVATDAKAAALELLAYPHISKYSLDTFSAFVDGTVEVDGDKLTNTAQWEPLIGGTAPAVTPTDITNALSLVEDANAQLIWIDSETPSDHALVTAHCVANQYWREAVYGIAASVTAAAAITATVEAAALINSARASLVACGIDEFAVDGSGVEAVAPKFFAAKVVGLIAGQPVQEPITRKVFTAQGLQFEFTKAQREALIQGGVLAPRKMDGLGLVVNQGVNTLQNNVNQWDTNTDTSPEISLNRSAGDFNKGMLVAADKTFVGGTTGVGYATMFGFVDSYCKSKEAEGVIAENDADQNNILPAYQDIVLERLEAGWSAAVSIRVNGPFNYFLLTTNVTF